MRALPALLFHRTRPSLPTRSLARTMSALTNGSLDAARAAVADQVRFDILTQSQDAVRAYLTPAAPNF